MLKAQGHPAHPFLCSCVYNDIMSIVDVYNDVMSIVNVWRVPDRLFKGYPGRCLKHRYSNVCNRDWKDWNHLLLCTQCCMITPKRS